ncbi:MAG: eS6 family ribosomal protein [Candidatus Kariarchaeaceae archaeon]|jgi:small subunit ribosomal protein S6e
MADKLIVNIGQKDGNTAKVILEGESRVALYGLNVGNEFTGDLINPDLSDYTFKITGGSDEDGIPMRIDLESTSRRRLLLSGGVGYNPKAKGIRRRKLIRGSEILDDIAQLNVKVVNEGKKALSEI